MNEAQQEIEAFQRARLKELLDQCTEPQRDLFARMYPNGPKFEQLTWAMQQCMNTLKKKK